MDGREKTAATEKSIIADLWNVWKQKARYLPALVLLALFPLLIGQENGGNTVKRVDLFIFMGQSNMSGRGVTSEEWPEGPPVLTEGAGFEFRAVSDPTALYPIAEPFGAAENRPGAIDDGSHKTGSMVTAFANAYYQYNGHIPIVAVSASNSGTGIDQWQPDGTFLPDALDRFHAAETYLHASGYQIRRRYMVWCQGESDGDHHVSAAAYREGFETMLDAMLNAGIEACFLCRIGEYNSALARPAQPGGGAYATDGGAYETGGGARKADRDYSEIIRAQTDICRENRRVIMATTVLCGMRARGLMKDAFHYYQAAYNEMGRYAGTNAALYANTGQEPVMYDPKYDNLYQTENPRDTPGETARTENADTDTDT